jgi:sucrose-6-phosphate hydrolase SacC (GH32 family)
MNDPNGLSSFDGLWHAYYQHNPDDDVWGPMHWRHATSADLVTWTDHGIALAPYELGAIFSGSIVLDADNTAGFGHGAKVAVFTLDDEGVQRQGVAWSPDGFAWSYHDGNPVLVDDDEKDFRDPKVMRYGDRWLMTLGVGHEVRFYRSDDLKKWEQTGSYRPRPQTANAIECPDLVPVTTESGDLVWLLVFGDDRGGQGGYSATVVATGQFDGASFVERRAPVLLDHGPDFYAAQSFLLDDVAPAGSAFAGRPPAPILMGWMNSWPYAKVHPSNGRRGVLSLPRRLLVDSASEQVRVEPAVDLDAVFPTVVDGRWISKPNQAAIVAGPSFRVAIRSTYADGIDVTVSSRSVSIRRADIGVAQFAAEVELRRPDDRPVTVVIDHGTVEVFTADGRSASMLFFCGPDFIVDTTGNAIVRVTAPGLAEHSTSP